MQMSPPRLGLRLTTRIQVSDQGRPTRNLAPKSEARQPKGGPPVIGFPVSPPPWSLGDGSQSETTMPPPTLKSPMEGQVSAASPTWVSRIDLVACRVLGTLRPGLERQKGVEVGEGRRSYIGERRQWHGAQERRYVMVSRWRRRRMTRLPTRFAQ
jgi:hypothetical protein